MVLPRAIAEASPLDPLLLLPLPFTLPPSPRLSLDAIIASLAPHLAPASQRTPPPPASSAGPAHPMPLLTTALRRTTRTSQVLLNAARTGAAEARDHLDGADVELRGVEYELQRVREEVARCEEYQPKYLELELEDESAFLSSADADVLAALPPPGDDSRDHALTIALLEHELAESLKRERAVTQLLKDRDALIKAKREIKLKFDASEAYLNDYIRTSAALASRIKDPAKIAAPPPSRLADITDIAATMAANEAHLTDPSAATAPSAPATAPVGAEAGPAPLT